MEIRILFLEDSDEAAETLIAALAAHPSADTFRVTRVARLTHALREVRSSFPDAALIDLGLPDSEGLLAAQTLNAAAPDLPIVVWTGHDSERDALSLIQSGIQDYLIKGETTAGRVRRSVLFAIKRKRHENRLRRLIRATPTRSGGPDPKERRPEGHARRHD